MCLWEQRERLDRACFSIGAELETAKSEPLHHLGNIEAHETTLLEVEDAMDVLGLETNVGLLQAFRYFQNAQEVRLSSCTCNGCSTTADKGPAMGTDRNGSSPISLHALRMLSWTTGWSRRLPDRQ